MANRPYRQDELEFLRNAYADWHDAHAVARVLGRTQKSVARTAYEYGIRPLIGRRQYDVRFCVTAELFEALKQVAREVGMTPPRTARMLLTACLRDQYLREVAMKPSTYVEANEARHA